MGMVRVVVMVGPEPGALRRTVCADCKGGVNSGRTVCSRCMTKRVARNRERREALLRRRLPMVVEPLDRGEMPVEHDLVKDSEQIPRRVWCRRYDKCLAHAASRDWEGFSCGECSIQDLITFADYWVSLQRRIEMVGVAHPGMVVV